MVEGVVLKVVAVIAIHLAVPAVAAHDDVDAMVPGYTGTAVGACFFSGEKRRARLVLVVGVLGMGPVYVQV